MARQTVKAAGSSMFLGVFLYPGRRADGMFKCRPGPLNPSTKFQSATLFHPFLLSKGEKPVKKEKNCMQPEAYRLPDFVTDLLTVLFVLSGISVFLYRL